MKLIIYYTIVPGNLGAQGSIIITISDSFIYKNMENSGHISITITSSVTKTYMRV